MSIHLQAQQAIPSEVLPVDTVKRYSEIDTDLSYSKDMIKPVSSVKINLDNVKFTNELSVLEFLQGRVSGLDISNISTNPGESAQALLHGQNLNDAGIPLIVIDGIPQQSMGNIFNDYYNSFGKMQDLIPVPLEDIQSVEVLKDGTSTALYGADGASGVILIETKKGSRQKLSLTYQFNQSFVNSPSYIPMLSGDEYTTYQIEAWHNSNGVYNLPREFTYDRDWANFYNYTANTDWMNAVTQSGNAANHELSFSGGNEKNRLYGSVNYRDETGTTINTSTKRLLNRLNFEHYFTKKLTLALNLSYGNSKDDCNSVDILDMAFKKAPHMSIWKYDAVGELTGGYFTNSSTYQGNSWDTQNPVAISETENALRSTNNFMTTAHLQYSVNDWLRFRETFSYNILSSETKKQLPYSMSDKGYMQFRNEIHAFVKVPFKEEQINSLNATFTWVRQDENISEKGANEYNANYTNSYKQSYNRKKNAIVSSVNYKLYNRYILTVNARMESNSMAEDSYKWDKFYGASLAWRFSEEPLFKNTILNNGLIHAGYSYSTYHPDLGFSSYHLYSQNGSNLDPIFNPNYNNVNSPVNYTIHIPSYDAGLELGLFDNRLHISTDYYYKKLDNQYHLPTKNQIIELTDKGWEGSFDFSIVNRKNLSWSLQFNIAQNEQLLDKLTNLAGTKPAEYDNGVYGTYVAEGKPLGSIYGFKNEGVYASNEVAYARGRDGNIYYNNGEPLPTKYGQYYTYKGGDTKYKDINYDGTIDDADLVYLGNSNPTYTGGFGSTVQFRNITLTCNFHYRTGNKVINQTAMEAEGLYGKNNMSKKMLNRWRVQGQQEEGLMPRADLNNFYNYLPSDRYVESGSFVRMNYLNLGYAFGKNACRKMLVKDLSLNLSGQRLYTYSKYSGLNPETEISHNYLSESNYDHSRISPPEVYTVSIRITI
jgi:TonB-linked SusC/RagA family outer membrane protein